MKHDFYTIVQNPPTGITFYEAHTLDEFEDDMKNAVRIYEKETNMAHQDFESVPDESEGLWFVATIVEGGRMHGFEFQKAGDLRKELPTLLENAEKDDNGNPEGYVVIFPPTAALVPEEKWIYMKNK